MVTQPGKRKRLYLDITISVQGMYQPISVASVSFFRLQRSETTVKYDYPDPQQRFGSQKNEIKRTADETLMGTKKKLFRADRKRHERDSPSYTWPRRSCT